MNTEELETYVRVRTTVYPDGKQTHYPTGRIPVDVLDADIIDERAAYGNQRGIQSVDDAARSVVALFDNGMVRITQYR